MYAIVRAGGRQHKVSVGDEIVIDSVPDAPGQSVRLPALLTVDGPSVTTDRAVLAGVQVSAEVLGATRGPKIDILKFHNKTGYRRRVGHRQRLTRIRITSISTGSDTGSGE